MSHFYGLFTRAPQVCNNTLKMDELSDEEMFQTTRFTRPAVKELLQLIGDDIERPTHRHHAVSAESQLLAALQFYASGSFQWMVGRSCSMSQPSVSNAIEAVTNSLIKLAPTFIHFPTDPQAVIANKLSFHSVAGFPNVLGAIDCSHIAIKAPSAHEEAFVNRKGVHTINIQAVCDNDMRITNLVSKWPGSTHDSFIWCSSGLRRLFEDGQIKDGWLLGSYILSFLLDFKLKTRSQAVASIADRTASQQTR